MLQTAKPLLLLGALFAASPQAFGQGGAFGPFGDTSTPREHALGVGAVAAENESGKSGLIGPTHGVGNRPFIGADYRYEPGRLEYEDPDYAAKTDVDSSNARVCGVLVLGRLSGARTYSGLTVAASQTKVDYDGIGRTGEAHLTSRSLGAAGSLGLGAATLGIAFHTVALENESSYSDTYESGDETFASANETKGDTSYDNFAVGAAFAPTSMARLAVSYRPKFIKWYREEVSYRNVNTLTGAVETNENTWHSLASEPELITVGGSFRLAGSRSRVLVGAEREVPFVEERNDSSETNVFVSPGRTTLGVGTELGRSGMATPRFGLANTAMKTGNLRKVAAGVDLTVERAVFSVGASYNFWHFEDEGDGTDYRAFGGIVGVGANL